MSTSEKCLVTPSETRTKSGFLRRQKPGLTAKGDLRLFVKHNYIDRAGENDEQVGRINSYAIFDRYELSHYGSDRKDGMKKTKPSPPFPLKLYMILNEVQGRDEGDIVSWLPHGRSFSIRNNDIFAREVLPKYFKKCKVQSFYRQLNLYGFTRLTAGSDTGSYYHEYFLRGKPSLTFKIRRVKVKGNKIRAASSPRDEPDFYSMIPMPDLSMDNKNAQPGSVVPIDYPHAQYAGSRDLPQNQTIFMPQKMKMDYNQLSAILNTGNPTSFAPKTNDKTSMAAAYDSHVSEEGVHNKPNYVCDANGNIQGSSLPMMNYPSSNLYESFFPSTRNNYLESNPHSSGGNLLTAYNPHLHNGTLFQNTSLHSSGVPGMVNTQTYDYQSSGILPCMLQTPRSLMATEDTQKMASIARALEMYKRPFFPNGV